MTAEAFLRKLVDKPDAGYGQDDVYARRCSYCDHVEAGHYEPPDTPGNRLVYDYRHEDTCPIAQARVFIGLPVEIVGE